MTKIALDAGHGLNTSGKQTPDGVKEWTLNDKVRDKVVKILSEYDVTLINTDNNEGKTDETLSSRLSKYLEADVDAFVSIHHNAYTGEWNNVTGIEVYVDRNATTKDTELANLIYNRMVEYTSLKGRGVKQANYTVINQNSVPAVLCEGGFMDGTKDYKIITSRKGQEAYAKAIAEGLIEFLDLKKKQETNTSEPKTDGTFKVEIQITNLNIRKGPGTNYEKTGKFTGKGVFTIIDTKTGTGSKNGWGKLKSGAGWISLDYVTKM